MKRPGLVALIVGATALGELVAFEYGPGR